MATRSLGQLTIDLIARVGGFTEGMTQAERAADRASRGMSNSMKKAAKDSEDSFQSITRGALKLATVLGVSLSVKQVMQYADGWSELNARVANAVGPGEAADRTLQRIAATARSTYSSLNQTADAFLRNSTTLTELGYSTEQQLDLSDALNNAMVISATRGQQAEAVMNALSKSFATGKLSGDQFNTVIGNSDRLMKALADGIGVSTQELRKMASDGLLTTEKAVNALTSQTARLREESESMAATLGDGAIQMGNSLMMLVGQFDQATGASSTLAEGIIKISDAISPLNRDGTLKEWAEDFDAVTDAAAAAGLVIVSRFLGPAIASLGSATSAMVIATQQSIAYQAALARTAGVSATAAAAQTALAGAATAASRAMGLLGGPVGVVLIAAGAIYSFREELGLVPYNAERASEAVDKLRGSIESLTVAGAERRRLDIIDELERAESALRKTTLEIEFFQEKAQQDISPAKLDEYEKRLIVLRDRFEQNGAAAESLRGVLSDLNQIIDKSRQGWMSKEDILKQIEKQYGATSSAVGDSSEEIKKIIKSLEDQQRQLTMTGREILKYNLAQAKAGEEDTKRAISLYDQNESLKSNQKANEDRKKAIESASKDIEKYFEREIELSREASEARNKTLEDARIQTDILGRQLAILGQGEAAQAALNRQLFIENALRSESYQKLLPEQQEEYRKLIEQQAEYSELISEFGKQSGPFAELWKSAIEDTRRWFADMFYDILDKGKVTFDDLLNTFKRWVAEVTATKVMISLGLAGGSTGAMAGGMGGSGGGFNLMSATSWVSAGKSLWSGFSGLASGQGLSAFGLGANGAFESAALKGGLEAAWAQADAAAKMTNAVNSWGPVLAGIGGAIQGWNTGQKANAVTGAIGGWGGAKAGAAAGTYILPGIGTAIGAIIGGILGSAAGASVFGTDYETTRGGIQLGFGEEGFDPQQWARQSKKGGWFGSSGRRMIYDQLDTELDTMLNTAYTTTVDGIAQMYAQIGVGVAEGALEGVQIATLQIGTFGKSEQTQEEIEAQIAQWFNELQEAMVGAIDSSLDFATLQVIAASLTSVNAIFDTLGITLYDLSVDGGMAAARLLEIAGGIEALAAASDFYYQNFYTEQERLETLTRFTTAALSDLGQELPLTREEFRRMVEAARDAGDAGQELFISLLNLSPAIDQIIKGVDDLALAAEQAAQQAAAALRNTLSDIAGTALNQYNTTLAERASLEDQLLGVNAQIADLMADMNESAKEAGRAISSIPASIDDITGSVDQLANSSSQLRSWAQSIQSAVQQLFLSDLSPLTNQQRLAEAQNQFARAQVLAENGDPSQVTGAAQAYLKEASSYFASSAQYSQIFAEVSGYLSGMGETLETEAQKAERIEEQQRRAQEAQRQATENVRAAMQEADQKAREDAQMLQQETRLQTLIAEQQRLEMALANSHAIDAEVILDRQLAALVDANDGIWSVAHLMSMLPQDLAAALGGVIGMSPAQYGGTTDLAERMFNQILGRAGSAAEIAYWRTLQASGIDGAALVDRFVQQMQAAGNTLLMSGSQFSSSIPAFASGGNYAGGMALVGERGPEIINFSSPGYVHNASETSSMLSGGALVPLVERLLNRIEAMEGLLEQNNRNNAQFHREDRQDMKEQTGEARRINSRLARTGEVEVLGAR